MLMKQCVQIQTSKIKLTNQSLLLLFKNRCTFKTFRVAQYQECQSAFHSTDSSKNFLLEEKASDTTLVPHTSPLNNFQKYSDKSSLYSGLINGNEINKDLETLLKNDWKTLTNKEMLEIFQDVTYIAKENKDPLTGIKYNSIVQNLTSRVPSLTDSELYHLLNLLVLWSSSKYYPLNEILRKKIDYECTDRVVRWTASDALDILNKFYNLKILPISQYSRQASIMLREKIENLSCSELVKLTFLIRHFDSPINMSYLEYCLQKKLDDISIADIGTIAMTYFRKETPVKNHKLWIKIIEKVIQNINTASDYTIAGICKILRYQTDLRITQSISDLLSTLHSQVHRLNVKSLVHIAQCQAGVLIYNHKLMSAIIKKFQSEIKNARLKDFERILFTLYMFNYDPSTCQLYFMISQELQKPLRQEEIKKFPFPFVYAVMYMLQVNYHEYTLLNKVMDPEFVLETCKHNTNNLNREYLILENCIDIEHPNYKGPRLRKDILNLLIKKFGSVSDYSSNKTSPTGSIFKSEMLLNSITEICKDLLGSEAAVHLDFLLPYTTQKYLIICLDKYNNVIPPAKLMSEKRDGTIKYAPNNKERWYAIIAAHHNHLTRFTYQNTGYLELQKRHLHKIGYRPLVIPFNIWNALPSKKKKINYVKEILYS